MPYCNRFNEGTAIGSFLEKPNIASGACSDMYSGSSKLVTEGILSRLPTPDVESGHGIESDEDRGCITGHFILLPQHPILNRYLRNPSKEQRYHHFIHHLV